ncbi:MAG: SDR family NAD(P)-dependent oxidoreductase [Bacteroidales bacterium]|nr:SDR family NAD(P)-dependent oxidoreductase [Bacteroidales bacterium]
MARIFITGSADGLGYLSAKLLVGQGHQVVLHARNAVRGHDALKKLPGAETVLTGDLSDIEDTIKLAEKVNASGPFDAVIHNAGIYTASSKEILSVNTLAPYILTSLIQKPKRVIYMSSGMHLSGHFKPESFGNGMNHVTYSDSKLHVLMLSRAVARRWPEVYSNAVNPGWVPTKMGGLGAPDDLQKGCETQAWLAVSNDEAAKVSGQYFFHQQVRPYNPEANDFVLQDKFLDLCKKLTGVSFP